MAALSPPPGFGPLPQLPEQSQLDKVKRPRDRRVSWATGDRLCQIRLFIAEDAPAVSGSVQEQLQAKQPRNFHIFNPVTSLATSDAPPGFGGVPIKPKPDHAALEAIVPQTPWRQPNKVKLDPTWLVMAGGASKEIGLQKQREVRVLEAVYPRPSAIPDSPAEPSEPQEPYDDASTTQIPLVPLEEEDVSDGNDISGLPLGPRFMSQASSGQVGGMPMVSPKVCLLPSSRPEKVKQVIGDNLPGPMQEPAHARKEYSWRDSSTLSTGRTPSNPSSHLTPNPKGVEPDIAAAAAAALAALSKSNEVGSMIDNDLLIQILSDPSLLQSLGFKPPFTTGSSKLDLSSSIALNAMSRGIEKSNQAQAVNVAGVGNPWISPASTSYTPVVTGGQEGSRTRIGEVFSNGGERFQRVNGSDDRSSSLLPATLGNGQLFTDLTSGKVGSGTFQRSNSTSAPPGFGNGNINANATVPPGFGNNSTLAKSSSQVGATTPARPLSRHDEQYYKSLIMQHGCKSADDDDHGRAGTDNQGNSGARASNPFSTPEVNRWYAREETDGARPERSGRDRGDRTGAPVENATRSKSRKACIYFATARGCRNGDNCMFVHEGSESDKSRADRVRSVPTHLQYAKRLKVDG